MGNQRISDLTPLASGSLAKNANVIPVVSGNETYQLTLTDLQSDLSPLSLKASGSVGFSIPTPLPGTWLTGGALNQARYHGIGGAGDKTSALAFGGITYSTYIPSTCTEAYDGSAWSVANSLIQGRANLAGFGTQGAAAAVGGNDNWSPGTGNSYTCTEAYDGSTWSAGGALITPRQGLAGAGNLDAGLVFSGYDSAPTSGIGENTCTEKYDGSTWSTGGALNQSRYSLSGTGTQNAALAAGGASNNTDDYYTSCTETYDGVAWTNQAGLSVNRYDHASSGTQNSALVFGGGNYLCDIAYLSNTEKWNGTTWSTDSPLSNGRYALGGAGNSTGNSIAFGGFNWDQSGFYWGNCTEEYTDGSETHLTRFDFDNFGYTSQTGSFKGTINLDGDLDVPGNLSVSSSFLSCNSSSFYGPTDVLADSKIYGSTILKDTLKLNRYVFNNFSTGGNLSQQRTYLAGIGDSQNAALAVGGQSSNSYASTLSCTEEYNGTSWSSGGSLSAKTSILGGAGTQNAGVTFGGTCYPGGINTNRTEEYDGTVWSLGGNMITARTSRSSAGTQNAALSIAGNDLSQAPSGIIYACCTEEYNGTSWSATSGLNTNLGYISGGVGTGTQNAALQIGGRGHKDGIQFPTTIYKFVESYDGTSWSLCPPIANNQCTFLAQGGGTVNDSLVSGIDAGYVGSAKFNGVSWEVGNSLPSCLTLAGNTNTGTNGALFGGSVGSATTTSTFEYADYGIETEIFGVDNSGNITSSGKLVFAQVSSSLDFVDDTAAAAGGVPLGGIYRSGSLVLIRLS